MYTQVLATPPSSLHVRHARVCCSLPACQVKNRAGSGGDEVHAECMCGVVCGGMCGEEMQLVMTHRAHTVLATRSWLHIRPIPRVL